MKKKVSVTLYVSICVKMNLIMKIINSRFEFYKRKKKRGNGKRGKGGKGLKRHSQRRFEALFTQNRANYEL